MLVNGKRRHGTANLTVAGRPLPAAAPRPTSTSSGWPRSTTSKCCQDGAAAQYGTDAIAGVVNIILEEVDLEGGSIGV